MDPTVVAKVRVRRRGGVLVHRPSNKKFVLEANMFEVTVGRGETCDFQIDDPKVSTTHCALIVEENWVRLRDLGSRNGTYYRGARIFDMVLDATYEIVLGDGTLEFSPAEPEEVDVASSFGGIVSRARKMHQVFHLADRAARADDICVHITGETGTGKEHLAKAIHIASQRTAQPFVTADMSGLSEGGNLAYSELFGHRKGAFTDAKEAKKGPFDLAGEGTIFLDEMGQLPLNLQRLILRAAAAGEIKPLGAETHHPIHCRIISAASQDLREMAENKEFHHDLLVRLTTLRIELPPLRDRLEDMELLAENILVRKKRPDVYAAITSRQFAWLKKQIWPGNVRQLEGALNLARALWSGHGPVDIEGAYHASASAEQPFRRSSRSPADDREAAFRALTVEGTKRKSYLREADRIVLEQVAVECGWNQSEIARRLKTGRQQVIDAFKSLDLKPPTDQVIPRTKVLTSNRKAKSK